VFELKTVVQVQGAAGAVDAVGFDRTQWTMKLMLRRDRFTPISTLHTHLHWRLASHLMSWRVADDMLLVVYTVFRKKTPTHTLWV